MKRALLSCLSVVFACTMMHSAVVLTEDFSKFTKGTDTAPDMESTVINSEGKVPDEMTLSPGWTGQNVYQAGGTAYIALGETSNLITPVLDLSANGGSYIVKFRAKADADNTPFLIVDNKPSYNFLYLSSSWTEYSIVMNGGSDETLISFPASYGGVYIDDIVIDDGGVGIPVLLPASDFTRESFTANWQETTGADSYSLNVFTLHFNTVTTRFERVYLIKDKIVTGTSYKVTDIDFGTLYYYTVAGCQGTNVTNEQETPMEVIPTEVSAPVAYEASDVADGHFTGSWSESDLATVYAMHVVKIHTAPADGEYDLINTDFSYITTDGTVENPQKELEYRLDGDWNVTMPAFAKGMLALNNQDPNLFGNPMLVSPVYDLSVGDGKISVRFDAMGRRNMTKGLIGVGHYTAAGGIEYLDMREFDVTEMMAPQQFDFTCGKQNSFIVISSEVLGMLFLDNLRVSVNMKDGERILVPIRTYETESTSCMASDLGIDDNDVVGYYVVGIFRHTHRDNYSYNPEVVSESSNAVIVSGLSGIDEIVDNASERVKVAVSGREITIDNPYGLHVAVFSADGRQLISDNSASVSYCVPAAGIYIVRTANRIFKVAVK